MTNRQCTFIACAAITVFIAVLPAVARAQASDSSDSSAPARQEGASDKKNDRIFGVVPNYVTVRRANNIPPLTAGGKFKLVARGAFDPFEFAIVGAVAGVDQALNNDSSLGQGFDGYAKRYGIDFANQAIGNFATGAIFPSLFRTDPRYFRLAEGGLRRRFDYALTRMVVTRTDSGHRAFNYSEFLGNATAAGLSNLYSPRGGRSFENNAFTFAEQLSIDALSNELREFWPDIHRKVFARHKIS
jgi:hypothetical protein